MLVPSVPHPAVTTDTLESTVFNQAPELGARSMLLGVSIFVFEESKASVTRCTTVRLSVSSDMCTTLVSDTMLPKMHFTHLS